MNDPLAKRLTQEAATDRRNPQQEILESDLAVVGGGLAGTCAAIAAAREGQQVVLIQDRPVLGGNASSEVRLWMLGATAHMGNNNRWARESGIVGEILVENLFRNPEGNPLIVDALLLEMVEREPNIRLLLNTAAFDLQKSSGNRIQSVEAFCSQNSTRYTIRAPWFMDCSGDGIIGFLAGAAFRMGAESKEEFNEKHAPDEDFGFLLGHSLYFYSKDTGKPVSFIKPAFADADIEAILPYRSFDLKDQGCRFWWIEYGGRTDTVHQTEEIKWELWKVVYGIWDYIKNSGKFPHSDTHTLEWVGMIPGKRESRRFEGLTLLIQQDVIEQRTHLDPIAFGGWSLDLHPADGVYSEKKPSQHWHSKGIYQIPLSATLSKNIENLAFGGRIISVSHVAFGSTRVMLTCAYTAQATAIALAYARENQLSFPQLLEPGSVTAIQNRLHRHGQHIPKVPERDPDNLAHQAAINSSSHLAFQGFANGGPGQLLESSIAMLLPAPAGRLPAFSLPLSAASPTQFTAQLRISGKSGNFTPDTILEEQIFDLEPGEQNVQIQFSEPLPRDEYCFLCFLHNPAVTLAESQQRITGILSVTNGINTHVSNKRIQNPPEDIGVESFEFWCPQRRPAGRNLALQFEKPVFQFDTGQLKSGYERPTTEPNAWVADPEDPEPTLTLTWEDAQPINKVVVALDTDFDHPMESVLWGHPERVSPFCVTNLKLLDEAGTLLGEVRDNHQTRVEFHLSDDRKFKKLTLQLQHPSPSVPAAVFGLRVYG